MIPNLAKTLAVIVCSTILATLAVNAVDMREHIVTTFLAAIFFSASDEVVDGCPTHMVLVKQALEPFCIDVYEAAASDSCVYKNPQTAEESSFNLANQNCYAESEPHKLPWTYVTQVQAKEACEQAHKRLPTANEWYKAAYGTADNVMHLNEEQCNIARNRADGPSVSGHGMRCVSDVGAYDMIGNVWEWVDETVSFGKWNTVTLPQTGYVQRTDLMGIATETGTASDERFQYDRFWSDSTIEAGMMRGGYYDSKSDGGLYATYAASPASFSGNATGFRCVTDPL